MRFRLKSGLTLNYRTRGAGRVVVFLHPIGCQLGIWDGVIGELEDVCRPLAIDFRGHGGSEFDGQPFTLADLAGDVIEMINALTNAPVVVAGCSMGGMVTQGVAATAPELISGFVIANTGHIRDEAGRKMMEARADAVATGMAAGMETTLARWFSERYRLENPDAVRRAREWLAEGDPVVHSHGWRAIGGLNFNERLEALDKPSLVISGSEDQSVGTDVMKSMAAALKHCTYHEIAGAGHLSPLEQPRQFAKAVREFLATLP